jgi:hypothetical protein
LLGAITCSSTFVAVWSIMWHLWIVRNYRFGSLSYLFHLEVRRNGALRHAD